MGDVADFISHTSAPISHHNIDNTALKTDRQPRKTSREVQIQTDVSTVIHPPNPFNMTARNFPRRHRNYIRASAANRTRASSFSPAKALDLVRAALQPSLNAELESVLKSYHELFKIAAINVRDNTGEVVSDEQVNTTMRKALEEAKLLFRTDIKAVVEKPERDGRSASPQIVRKKRRPRTVDTTKDDGVPLTKTAKPDKNVHYEWDPDTINYDTDFVMGVKANKALGFAATRGKLYYRHPELFRYVGDQEDKQWLYENGYLPITGGKAFLMIKDNIHDLAINHEDYKNNENTNLDVIRSFKVCPRIVDKMKVVMRRSQISRDKKDDSKTVFAQTSQLVDETSSNPSPQIITTASAASTGTSSLV